MEKPEEERSLLLKCLPPVGNISKWSGTKTSRTGPLQNVPKADFFQSSLAASKLLPHLEQQSRCQNTECRQLAQPPAWLRSCTVYTASQSQPSVPQSLSPHFSKRATKYTSSYTGQHTQTNFFLCSLDSSRASVLICEIISTPAGFCENTEPTKCPSTLHCRLGLRPSALYPGVNIAVGKMLSDAGFPVAVPFQPCHSSSSRLCHAPSPHPRCIQR